MAKSKTELTWWDPLHSGDSLGSCPTQIAHQQMRLWWLSNQPRTVYHRRLFQQQTVGLGSCTTGGTSSGKQLAATHAAVFLDNSQEPVGTRWAVAGFGVLWDFCKGSQTQHWHQTWNYINLVNTTCPTLVTTWDPAPHLTHMVIIFLFFVGLPYCFP